MPTPHPQPAQEFSETIIDSLRGYRKGYLSALRRCRKHSSQKAVHRLRLTSRRFIALLSFNGELAAEDHFEGLHEQIRSDLKILGRLRNSQLQRAYLKKLRYQHPELKALLKKLRTKQSKRERRVRKVLHKRKPRLIRASLKASTRSFSSQIRRGEDSLLRVMFAASCQRRVQRLIELEHSVMSGDRNQLHALRLEIKDARYLIEAFPTLHRGAHAELPLLRTITSLIGRVRDTGEVSKLIQQNSRLSGSNEIILATLSQHDAKALGRVLSALESSIRPSQILARILDNLSQQPLEMVQGQALQ